MGQEGRRVKMDRKNAVLITCALLAAAANASVASSDSLVLGYMAGGDTNATPVEVVDSVAVGDFALWGADEEPTGSSVLVGTEAGVFAGGMTNSVGVGAGVFARSRGLTNCVAIGPEAGRGWTNETGRVQIGQLVDGHVGGTVEVAASDVWLNAEPYQRGGGMVHGRSFGFLDESGRAEITLSWDSDTPDRIGVLTNGVRYGYLTLTVGQ